MANISAVGVDLGKNIIHVQAGDSRGKKAWRKKVNRDGFRALLAQLPQGCEVYMEACGGAHYWSRKARENGLNPKQMAPQFVKAYRKSDKNDYNDAEATLEAGGRPNMRFVAMKTAEQQELQQMHRIRSRQMRDRTALINEMRGMLAEYGIVAAKSPGALKKYLAYEFHEEHEIPPIARQLIEELRDELSKLEQRIKSGEIKIRDCAKVTEVVQRLMTIPGVGILTATALAVVCGNPKIFKNGRQFAAWLGLVPRQDTTGGKARLRGISKRGDVYTRTLLIHGARSVVRHALNKGKEDKHSLWIRKIHAGSNTNLTAVAVANKNARIAWRILTSQEVVYNSELSHAPMKVQ